MGGCTAVLPQAHTLMLGLQRPPSILSLPWPIPKFCLAPPSSHYPPPPLDGGEMDKEEFETWELSGDWIVQGG